MNFWIDHPFINNPDLCAIELTMNFWIQLIFAVFSSLHVHPGNFACCERTAEGNRNQKWHEKGSSKFAKQCQRSSKKNSPLELFQENNVKETDLISSAEEKEEASTNGDIKCNGCNGDAADHKETDEAEKESPAEAEKPAKDEHDHLTEIRLKNLMDSCNIRAVTNDENSDTKSIYLDGELPHDSKILVSASETTTEIAHHEDDMDTDDDVSIKRFFEGFLR